MSPAHSGFFQRSPVAAFFLLLVFIWPSLALRSAQPTAPNRTLELDAFGAYAELPPNIFNNLTEATIEAWVRWDDFGSAKTVEAPAPFTTDGSLEERVLELDGSASFVELPPAAFTNLTEVTVEGWVKWQSFENFSRFFDFTLAGQSLNVHNRVTSPSLWFQTFRGTEVRDVIVPELLKLGQWTHIAAVLENSGSRLYVDGVLVSTNTEIRQNAVADRMEKRNYLGRSNFRVYYTHDADFRGQMDEVRVWRSARTEQQVRENMFKSLSGREPGLAGLWNFNDGTANDASTNAQHGKLLGQARVMTTRRPAAKQSNTPVRIVGKAIDGSGNAMAHVQIRDYCRRSAVPARSPISRTSRWKA